MSLNCRFDELDTETKTYLLETQRAKGRGSPGVFVAMSDSKPGLGCVFGPIIAIGVFIFSLSSSKDPWAVAMLQTAGFLLGGWLLVFAFRRWASQGSEHYAGHFQVFDPLHIYEVSGETVRVTPLQGVDSIEAVGSADSPKVRIEFKGSQAYVIAMNSVTAAVKVQNYYHALGQIEQGEAPAFANTDVAMQGAAALFAAKEDEFPKNREDVNLEFETIPLSPEKGNRSSAGIGLIGPVLTLGAGALMFLLFWQSNQIIHDELAFENAKGEGPTGLRGYLLDPRNVAHREEAKQMLSQAYDAPINRIRALPPGTNPKLREAMLELVNSLRTADQGVLSITVKGSADPKANPVVTPDSSHTSREIADSLARTIGPTLLAFVEAPPDKPAHIEIVYRIVPQGNLMQDLTITATLRSDINGEPIATETVKIPRFLAGTPQAVQAQIVEAMLRELAGERTVAPPPDLGDF